MFLKSIDASLAIYTWIYLWFGVLNGSSISFITIYFARIQGTGTQIGLLGALPAIVALIFTLPVGTWLQYGNTNLKVINASFIHRIFYLLWVPIPLLFLKQTQIELLLIITFIMSFPGTILQVGFNSLFAESVPANLRGYVAGVRNALFAIVSILATLISGQILNEVKFSDQLSGGLWNWIYRGYDELGTSLAFDSGAKKYPNHADKVP